MRFVSHAACISVLALTAGCSETQDDRADLMREVEAQIASLDERFQALDARMRDADVEEEFHELMADLEKQKAKLDDSLEDLAEAGEERWRELVEEVRDASRELEAETNALLDRLDDEN